MYIDLSVVAALFLGSPSVVVSLVREHRKVLVEGRRHGDVFVLSVIVVVPQRDDPPSGGIARGFACNE